MTRVQRLVIVLALNLALVASLVIVGAVVTFVAYLLLTRNLDVKSEQAAIDRSEAELRAINAADN